MADLKGAPHRRYNPLTREWVLVSPKRTQRPWRGKVEQAAQEDTRAYDPDCYLCPGNSRAGGVRNPTYTSTFIFDNDYPALIPSVPDVCMDESNLIVAHTEAGICRVLCFSPRHHLAISRMTRAELGLVVDQWIEQHCALAALAWVNYVQIFENRGAIMGTSNAHPHCQIWANATVPDLPLQEERAMAAYQESHSSCLLCDYLRLESKLEERLVCENQDFAAVLPFWAVWPFEILVISKRHLKAIDELRGSERDSLADILKRITTRYDNLFQISFPYSMGFHQRPTDKHAHSEWHFHAHYYPPLLRSATVQKFMVGYEMLAMPQRDIMPESAAARLREVGEVHYTQQR